MNRIAVFLGEGFEEIEALTVVDICRRAEIDTIMVSVGEEQKVTGSHGISVLADQVFEEVDFDRLDMLVLPGGKAGTEKLEAHNGLLERLDDFYREGRYIAAICAAPSILGHLGMLKDRRACSYPSFEGHLEGARVVQDEVAVSEHVITSRGMGCSIPFALTLAAVFRGQEIADKLAESIIYKK